MFGANGDTYLLAETVDFARPRALQCCCWRMTLSRMEPYTKPLKALIGLTCRWDETNGWYYLPADYSRAVAAAGGIPVQIPLIQGIVEELASRLDAFVLCGSPSDVDPARYGQPRHPQVTTIQPERDETDWRVLDHVFQKGKPVLGICFGMQSLNVYRGGTLVQDIPEQVRGALDHGNRELQHVIALEAGSRLAGWTGGIRELLVNSTHHQSPDRIGAGLRVAARATDGVIEAIEEDSSDHFVVGVEWHPERMLETEPLAARIFRELVLAAGRIASSKGAQGSGGTHSIVETAR